MKKFLSKLPVMIISIILSVALLVFYIVMLARPISYGMNYKYTTTEEGTEVSIIINVKNKKTAIVSSQTEYSFYSSEIWIYYSDNYIYLVGAKESMSETDYDTEVLRIKDNRASAMAEYKEGEMLLKTSAFKMTIEGDELKCTGAIVFAIVMIIVELAVITFAILSAVFTITNKKRPLTDIQTPVIN